MHDFKRDHRRRGPRGAKLTVSGAAKSAVLSSDVSVVEIVIVDKVGTANALEDCLEVVIAVKTELQLA
jgi:hypothetical protein